MKIKPVKRLSIEILYKKGRYQNEVEVLNQTPMPEVLYDIYNNFKNSMKEDIGALEVLSESMEPVAIVMDNLCAMAYQDITYGEFMDLGHKIIKMHETTFKSTPEWLDAIKQDDYKPQDRHKKTNS